MSDSLQIQDGENHRALTVLRVLLYLLPSVFLVTGLAFVLRSRGLWPLVILSVLLITATIGYLDGRISLKQQRIEPSREKWQLIRWSMIFPILQLVIAPLFSLVIIFGLSSINFPWIP
jgi:hypothetical protein